MVQKPEFVAEITQRRLTLRSELASLLPPGRPLIWEIGCGHGHFLVRYAEEHPATFCVGVDIRLERLARSDKKRTRAQLPNCTFVRAEAREFLLALPATTTFAEVWILFPDPWPKARHHKNRLLKADFLEAVAARAGEGTPFYFRTDHKEYFDEVTALIPTLTTWKLDPSAPWPLEQETVFQARAAAGYHSLVALRTKAPARPVIPVAPGLPAPATPTSSA